MTIYDFRGLNDNARSPREFACRRVQFKEADPGGAKVGEARVQRWRAGVVVKAAGRAVQRIVGYMPLPTEWPEQQVKTSRRRFRPRRGSATRWLMARCG